MRSLGDMTIQDVGLLVLTGMCCLADLIRRHLGYGGDGRRADDKTVTGFGFRVVDNRSVVAVSMRRIGGLTVFYVVDELLYCGWRNEYKKLRYRIAN